MPAVKAEIAYITKRLATSIRQGERAAGQCSRVAHEGLTKLYRRRLTDLSGENAPILPLQHVHEIGLIGRLESPPM